MNGLRRADPTAGHLAVASGRSCVVALQRLLPRGKYPPPAQWKDHRPMIGPTSPAFAIAWLAVASAPPHADGGQAVTSLLSFQALIALVTLTILEIVLGIDNIVFISVLAD